MYRTEAASLAGTVRPRPLLCHALARIRLTALTAPNGALEGVAPDVRLLPLSALPWPGPPCWHGAGSFSDTLACRRTVLPPAVELRPICLCPARPLGGRRSHPRSRSALHYSSVS